MFASIRDYHFFSPDMKRIEYYVKMIYPCSLNMIDFQTCDSLALQSLEIATTSTPDAFVTIMRLVAA